MAGMPKRETTAQKYELIRAEYRDMYESKNMRPKSIYKALGRKYGMSPRTIEDICTGSSR